MIKSYSYLDIPETETYVIEQLSQNTNLNEWEHNFIQSIKDYTDKGGFLSDRQKQKLSDLWEKY